MSKNQYRSGRVTRKGQVTIPVEMRKALNIEEGDQLEFVRESDAGYKIEVVKKKSLREVVGILKTDKKMPDDFEEVRKIVHREMAKENLLKDFEEEDRR